MPHKANRTTVQGGICPHRATPVCRVRGGGTLVHSFTHTTHEDTTGNGIAYPISAHAHRRPRVRNTHRCGTRPCAEPRSRIGAGAGAHPADRPTAVRRGRHILLDVLRRRQSHLPAARRRVERPRGGARTGRLHHLGGRTADPRGDCGGPRRWVRASFGTRLPPLLTHPRRGDHAHDRPAVRDSTHGVDLVRDGGRAVSAQWRAPMGAIRLFRGVLRPRVCGGPAS